MHQSQIAIRLNEISRDPETAIEIAAEWGVHALELALVWLTRAPDLPPAQVDALERALAEHGSRLICLSPGLFKEGPREPAEALAEGLRRFEASLPLCERFGIRLMGVFAPRSHPEATLAWTIDRFGELAARAEREGLTLLLEPEAITPVDSGRTAAEVARAVNSPALRVNWDPGNVQHAGYAAYPEEWEHARPYTTYVHLKNWKARGNEGKGAWSVLDDGDIDYPAQLRALRDDGYGGWLVVETHCKRAGLERGLVAATRHNVRVLRRYLAEIAGD